VVDFDVDLDLFGQAPFSAVEGKSETRRAVFGLSRSILMAWWVQTVGFDQESHPESDAGCSCLCSTNPCSEEGRGKGGGKEKRAIWFKVHGQSRSGCLAASRNPRARPHMHPFILAVQDGCVVSQTEYRTCAGAQAKGTCGYGAGGRNRRQLGSLGWLKECFAVPHQQLHARRKAIFLAHSLSIAPQISSCSAYRMR